MNGPPAIAGALGAAGYTLDEIARSMVAPGVYPDLDAFALGTLLKSSVAPSASAADMRSALQAAGCSAPDIDAAIEKLFPAGGSLRVRVRPPNAGDVTVKVWLASSPGGTALDQTFTASSSSPLDQTWQLDAALYAVTISWQQGYQNIASGTDGNEIAINGVGLYYQVLGTPSDANGIMATFGCQL